LINSRGWRGWMRSRRFQRDQQRDLPVILVRRAVASALRQPCRHGSRLRTAQTRYECASRRFS